jgi:hypothetical protein
LCLRWVLLATQPTSYLLQGIVEASWISSPIPNTKRANANDLHHLSQGVICAELLQAAAERAGRYLERSASTVCAVIRSVERLSRGGPPGRDQRKNLIRMQTSPMNWLSGDSRLGGGVPLATGGSCRRPGRQLAGGAWIKMWLVSCLPGRGWKGSGSWWSFGITAETGAGFVTGATMTCTARRGDMLYYNGRVGMLKLGFIWRAAAHCVVGDGAQPAKALACWAGATGHPGFP